MATSFCKFPVIIVPASYLEVNCSVIWKMKVRIARCCPQLRRSKDRIIIILRGQNLMGELMGGNKSFSNSCYFSQIEIWLQMMKSFSYKFRSIIQSSKFMAHFSRMSLVSYSVFRTFPPNSTCTNTLLTRSNMSTPMTIAVAPTYQQMLSNVVLLSSSPVFAGFPVRHSTNPICHSPNPICHLPHPVSFYLPTPPLPSAPHTKGPNPKKREEAPLTKHQIRHIQPSQARLLRGCQLGPGAVLGHADGGGEGGLEGEEEEGEVEGG